MKTKDQIQDEAQSEIGDLQLSGVEISMGVGKCYLGVKHMAKNYHETAKFMVVAPKKTIFKSWQDDITEFNYQGLLPHIEFSTYRSLTKHALDYDVIYLDECHSLKESHEAWLDAYVEQGGIILGLTGTYPIRKNTEKGKMCNKFCPKVYEYLTDDAVDDKILNDYKIFVHMLYLDGAPTIPVKTKKGGEFMTTEVKSYQYWNTRLDAASTPKSEQIARIQRMKALQGFPSKERYARKLLGRVTKKTLVFANTQAQADRLCVHSVHSKNKKSDENLQLFKDGEILKLSAVDQLSEGVSIPDLETGIIMHSYANNRKAAQKIGRFLRLSLDKVATVHVLCYMNSVDKDWVESALESFDQSKIQWIHPIT
jgi:superfamily II DNA or RNA helicase